jgi:hypothetical protein
MWTFPPAAVVPQLVDLARLPFDLAGSRVWEQTRRQLGLFSLFQHPDAQAANRLAGALREGATSIATLPFDLARAQHAAAVLAGAWPRSLLESTQFEQQLDAIERLALGPLARGV